MTTLLDLLAVQRTMREQILSEAHAAGINPNNFRIAGDGRRTEKRRRLIGEMAQMRGSGYFNLDRWAKNGWTYDQLREHVDIVAFGADRHRKPYAARVREH